MIAYTAMGNWNGAASALEQAGAIADKLYVEDPIRFGETKLSILSGKATVCWKQKKLEDAAEYADKAIETLSEMGFIPNLCAKAWGVSLLRWFLHVQLNDIRQSN